MTGEVEAVERGAVDTAALRARDLGVALGARKRGRHRLGKTRGGGKRGGRRGEGGDKEGRVRRAA